MAITDQFKKSESLFSTTLSASIGTGTGETITLASVTGLPTDTEITITIDRVDTNGTATPSAMERITGTISGSNLTSYTRGTDGSTEQSHASGAVVEYIWNSQDWNDAIDGILVEHAQDGTHGAVTATSVTSTGTVEADELTIQSANIRNGWFAADETWTYSAWDDTNGVSTATITVPSDATAKYQPGMRIKFTQSTGGTKYGIITSVPSTTSIVAFINTDYQLENEAISSPFYSPMKAPFGFDLDPNKWKVEVLDTSNRSQASPTASTYYNLGSISIDVPTGAWSLMFNCLGRANDTAGTTTDLYVALSTANDSSSDAELRANHVLQTGSSNNILGTTLTRQKSLVLSTKDTYYLNAAVGNSGIDNLWIRGDLSTTIIRAICAYL